MMRGREIMFPRKKYNIDYPKTDGKTWNIHICNILQTEHAGFIYQRIYVCMCLCVSAITMRKDAMNVKKSNGNTTEDLEEARKEGKCNSIVKEKR